MKDKQQDKLMWRRYVDDLYTKEDAGRLLEELHNPDSSRLLDDLAAEIWEESAIQQTYTDLEREKYKKEAQQLLQRLEHKKQTWIRRVCYAVSGIAAMLCLVWGSMAYLNYVSNQQISYLEASTSYGEHKEVVLPDGTVLTLNSCSRVRYPNQFVDNERRVELEGEGFFQVSRNENQPFIINTHFFDVRVLGTSFNVKSYSSDETVMVDVESGKIQVDMPEAMMRLTANERVLINTLSGEYAKQKEEGEVASWRTGSLRFYRTPLFDVARELERRYHCRIVFADGVGSDNLISGQHDNKTLEAVLRSIEYASGIRYRAEGDSIVLYK